MKTNIQFDIGQLCFQPFIYCSSAGACNHNMVLEHQFLSCVCTNGDLACGGFNLTGIVEEERQDKGLFIGVLV